MRCLGQSERGGGGGRPRIRGNSHQIMILARSCGESVLSVVHRGAQRWCAGLGGVRYCGAAKWWE